MLTTADEQRQVPRLLYRVMDERKSLAFKNLAVWRIYDEAHRTMVYVVYSREVEGSAKMNISTVALHGADVTWANGADQ